MEFATRIIKGAGAVILESLNIEFSKLMATIVNCQLLQYIVRSDSGGDASPQSGSEFFMLLGFVGYGKVEGDCCQLRGWFLWRYVLVDRR